MFQQFGAERRFTVNVKQTKVKVLNSANACQKFVFEGDAIEHV